MSYRLSAAAAQRIGDAVRKVENNPTVYGNGSDGGLVGQNDTFCYAYVVDASGPVVDSGAEYDLTEPVKCRRVVEDSLRQVIKLDASGMAGDSVDITVGLNGASFVFNTLSDDSATLTASLDTLGATGSEGIIVGKYVYLSQPSNGDLTVTVPSSVIKSTCNEWLLEEEEDFFLSDLPTTDLEPGDLVKVHFSLSQGGLIVSSVGGTAESEDCCAIHVINSTNLQITIPEYVNGTATGGTRTLNTTRTWITEINRDITYTITGGFAKIKKGNYILSWSSVTNNWSRNVADDLVFMDNSGRLIDTNPNSSTYVTINSASMVMTPDDGAGNLALNLSVDATVTT